MKTLRTTMAVALLGLALTAFQSDALAQTRRGGRSSSSSRTTSTTSRSSSTASRSTSTSRSSKPAQSNSSSVRGAGSRSTSRQAVTTSSRSNKPEGTTVHRPSTSVSRSQQKTNQVRTARPAGRSGNDRQEARVVRSAPPVQIRPNHKPDPHRVHPRERDFMHYNRPSYFWASHNHCYGHRVKVIPSYAHRHIHHGVTYYCYNDIWYRPYGGYYVVCRPPFGTVLAANLVADMTWAAITFSYYNTVSRTYSQINANNEYIAQQNALIAQNNAVIAAQNAQIAAGQQQAQMAYTLANGLGLVQSYAAAGSSYYYQDGVFYTMDTNGQYSVIVPPAGALVETFPEDYDLVTLADGNQYYKVDYTVYKVTIVEGKPYFEVLGQLYE